MPCRVPLDLLHEAFEVLHQAGWADCRIAAATRAYSAKVRAWREERGLPRNLSRQVKIDEAEAHRMYDAGANDHIMAQRFGVHHTAVLYWRQRRGLPPNCPTVRWSDEDRRKARKMLRRGATRRQVATEIGHGANLGTVGKLRSTMSDPGLRPTGLTNRSIRQQVLKDHGIERRIMKAIGPGLPSETKYEAFTGLYTDVLGGLVAVDFIEKVAPSYRNQAFNMCGSKFGPRSIDEDIGEDWTLMDSLEDPAALASMEAAAEAAWNDNSLE